MVDKFRSLLELAHRSLDHAVADADRDSEAALDDMIAARLLIATALATLGTAASVVS